MKIQSLVRNMANLLITNIGNITDGSNKTQLYLCQDTAQNKLKFLAYIKKVNTGTTGSPVYAYKWFCINKNIFLTMRNAGTAVILDNSVDVASLADGLMLSISTTAVNGTGECTIPNLTANAELYEKGDGTATQEIVGSGILLTDYFSGSGLVVPPVNPPVNPPGGGIVPKTAAQLAAEKVAADALALEEKRKTSFAFGLIASFRSADGTGTLDSAINWVLDNTILAVVAFLVAWNYLIVPQFFPTVSFLTWGDTKTKAEMMAKRKSKK